MNFKTFTITLLCLISTLQNYAQSAFNYKIDTFTSSYDTLTEFNSIPKELVADMDVPWSSWSRTFPLDFTFPFFDTTTNEIFLTNKSIGGIPSSPVYNFFLFDLFWGVYTKDLKLEDFTTSKPLQSDFRYNHVVKNNKKAFVMENKNVGLDPAYDGEFYSAGRVNFQTWFWENGDIELKFGEIDLDGIFVNGLVPGVGDSSALLLRIQDYFETKTIIIEDKIENFKIVPNFNPSPGQGYVKSLPHKDFVFRFTYMPTATNEVVTKQNNKAKLISTTIEDELYQNKKYGLYDLNGTIIIQGKYNGGIDVAHLPKGFYFLKLDGHDKISSEIIKVVKM